MKDYLITVEASGGMNPQPIHSERLINKSEDYANGMLQGFKIAFPNNEVYKEEIPN